MARARTDLMPLVVPRIDPSANKLYIHCIQCGARRSAVWRDKPKRIAICTVCIEENLRAMLVKFREEKHQAQLERLEARKVRQQEQRQARKFGITLPPSANHGSE